MVTDTPLDPDSWEYRGEYVPNEGNFGMGWGNNHTRLQKFEDTYYLFYHSTLLEQTMKTGASGFRSIGVNQVRVNENTQKIAKVTMDKTGVEAIRNLNPYVMQQAETMATCGGVSYEDFSNPVKPTSISDLGNDAAKNLLVKMKAGAWTMVRNVDFGTKGAKTFTLRAKGTGTMQVRLDSKTATPVATVEFSTTTLQDYTIEIDPTKCKDVKNVYFVCTASTNAQFDAWQFSDEEPDAISVPFVSKPSFTPQYYDFGGRLLNGKPRVGSVYIDEQGRKFWAQ